MRPTPHPDLNALLSRMLEEQRGLLGPSLIGVYLQGSIAIGDFDEHSDVDFIAVVARPLSAEDAAKLSAMHARLFQEPTPWAQHLEGSYFTREELTGPVGEPVWYLDHGSVELQRSNHCNTLVVRWTLEHGGVTLFGPGIQTLVEPVAAAALKREVRQTLLNWGKEILDHPEPYANRFYQGFITISYCRMLQTLCTGRVESKRSAGEWAKHHLPTRWHDLIDRSWDSRPDPATSVRTPADPSDFSETLELVRWALKSAE